MNVKELIIILKGYNPEILVVAGTSPSDGMEVTAGNLSSDGNDTPTLYLEIKEPDRKISVPFGTMP